MTPLILHPASKSGPVCEIFAAITPTVSGCHAEFRMVGDIGAIRVPVQSSAIRQDDLWKTTCFEIFWQMVGETEYREFNLSPSSRWASYHFGDVRLNRRDAPVEAISISCAQSDETLELEVHIAARLALPAVVALTAIVEDRQGNIQFWALDFPEGKPDFHSEICRTLHLETVR